MIYSQLTQPRIWLLFTQTMECLKIEVARNT